MRDDRRAPGHVYELRLYVAGQTPRSAVARINLERVCAGHLAGRHTIEVVDLLEQPGRARADGIIALPTLVRSSPAPRRLIVGDLSNLPQLLAGLDLTEESA